MAHWLLLLLLLGARSEPNLYEVRLPAGTHGSLNIGWSDNGAPKLDPKTWLDDGDDDDPEPDDFDGIRFVGAGTEQTIIRCTSWDGITVAVAQHPGIVQFERLTIHAGYAKAVHFGLASRAPPIPQFKLRMVDCKGYVPQPTEQGRTKWLLFGYNSDVELVDCTLDAINASEHASYWHGFARYGLTWTRVTVIGSGAEGCKVRSDVTETAWAGREAQVRLFGCDIRNWYQTHSDRGGAAVVLQGAAADLIIDSCIFVAGPALPGLPASSRAKCVMVSSEGDSYDTLTGAVGTGFGNGFVYVRRSMIFGGPGQENYTTLLRVGRNGGAQLAARGVLVEGCGLYGRLMNLQLKDTRAARVRDCNTPAIKARCTALGIDTTHQASITLSDRVVPVSDGFVQ
jgi:hypothetical protein